MCILSMIRQVTESYTVYRHRVKYPIYLNALPFLVFYCPCYHETCFCRDLSLLHIPRLCLYVPLPASERPGGDGKAGKGSSLPTQARHYPPSRVLSSGSVMGLERGSATQSVPRPGRWINYGFPFTYYGERGELTTSPI